MHHYLVVSLGAEKDIFKGTEYHVMQLVHIEVV